MNLIVSLVVVNAVVGSECMAAVVGAVTEIETRIGNRPGRLQPEPPPDHCTLAAFEPSVGGTEPVIGC